MPKETKWKQHQSALHVLHHEIVSFAESCEQPKRAEKAVMKLQQQVESIVRQHVPGATANLFGSQAAGLSLPSSDIDLVILAPSIKNWSKERILNLFYLLQPEFEEKIFQSVEVIEAFVPVMKCKRSDGGGMCDISCGMDSGVEASKFMKGKMQKHKQIQPLVLVLKQLLKERYLNEVFTGGLSSYSLFHLVFSFVQSTAGPKKTQVGGMAVPVAAEVKAGTQQFPYFVRTEVKNDVEVDSKTEEEKEEEKEGDGNDGVVVPRDLGKMLIEILDLYSGEDGTFDPLVQAIHPSHGLVLKRQTRLEYPANHYRKRFDGDLPKLRFAIVDCMDPTNDVSRGCFRTSEVMMAFSFASMSLKEVLKSKNTSGGVLSHALQAAPRGDDDGGQLERKRKRKGEDTTRVDAKIGLNAGAAPFDSASSWLGDAEWRDSRRLGKQARWSSHDVS